MKIDSKNIVKNPIIEKPKVVTSIILKKNGIDAQTSPILPLFAAAAPNIQSIIL